jgi:predicted nucleic acid-binding Zn ribbon protein
MSNRERGKTVSVKDSIEEYLDKYALRESFNLSEIKTLWVATMGNTIAKRTTDIFFKDQKLMVKIESGPLKHQLHMQRTQLKDKLNEAIGKAYVREIIFL